MLQDSPGQIEILPFRSVTASKIRILLFSNWALLKCCRICLACSLCLESVDYIRMSAFGERKGLQDHDSYIMAQMISSMHNTSSTSLVSDPCAFSAFLAEKTVKLMLYYLLITFFTSWSFYQLLSACNWSEVYCCVQMGQIMVSSKVVLVRMQLEWIYLLMHFL